MSEVGFDIEVGQSAVGASNGGAEAAFDLNAGFLGTGASSVVELSYVAMLLIVVYVAHGTFRYFLPDVRITAKIFSALGLR